MISDLGNDKVTNQGELIIVYLCLYLYDPVMILYVYLVSVAKWHSG